MASSAGPLNRFANIFWHYYSGPLAGFRQQLWPKERPYSIPAQSLAVLLYLAQLTILLVGHLPPVPRLGLALILFSPQWLYVYTLPHPVFEFRAYGMAAGVALILISVLRRYPAALIVIASIWFFRTLHRRRQLIEPLKFWSLAQEEHHGP